MKKFERLPVESRRKEIQTAASELFLKKGFRATTMENIVEKVSLSKGGVYRIYPSTTEILKDIILNGMQERNRFYQSKAEEIQKTGNTIQVSDLLDVICDGMLLIPDVAALYVEFLIEKRHNQQLEMLYQDIYTETVQATANLIKQVNLPEECVPDTDTYIKIGEIMNTAVLGIIVLGHTGDFSDYKKSFYAALLSIMKGGNIK